ncbi:MAG: sugar phosphate isomerase/epimerase [Clostridiaceae bacterium]|nr:sugar phosphate isomerase/epimerase [Clostridiaceae bacterium]
MEKKPLLCLGTGMDFNEIADIDQLEFIKAAGFDQFFYTERRNQPRAEDEAIAEKAAKLGIGFHSIHAPFYGMDDLWHDEDGELAEIMRKELFNSIDNCHNLDVPIVVMHAIIGMDNHTPTELGLERIGEIIDYAVKRGVVIGFENTEGECYLKALLDKFGEIENVGFTFDSGHELCYNGGSDMLGKYGKYLVSTHLDDNHGMSDPEHPNFLDDYHLLPFDGYADWEGIARRLNKCGFEGSLTFEVDSKGRCGSHSNDMYLGLSLEQYVAKAYEHAVRFRELVLSVK